MTWRAGFATAIGLSILIILAARAFGPKDPFLDELLMLLMGGDSTVYAEGFTEDKFDRVRVGRSMSEVTDSLGPPMERWSFEREGTVEIVLAYTTSSSDSHYRRRQVYLIDSTVVEKSRSIHID